MGVCAFIWLLVASTLFSDVVDSADYIGSPTILDAVLFAPILEELLFRSWVTNWLPGLYGGLFSLTVLCIGFIWKQPQLMIIGAAILLSAIIGALLFQAYARKHGQQTLPTRTVLVVGLLANLVFALVHATNYELAHMPLWHIPILVLSQLMVGTVILTTRLRLGLLAGMLMHSALNAELMLHIAIGTSWPALAILLGIGISLAKLAILAHLFWERRARRN